MLLYRIDYVDQGGNVRGSTEAEHADDEIAIEAAYRSYAPSLGEGFDLWEGERLVYRNHE